MTRNFGVLLAVGLLSILAASPGAAEDLRVEKRSWISTGPSNSLDPAPGLFSFRGGLIRTQSEEINIHAHYKDRALARLKNYTFTGEFRIADADGGVGVTFHSKYRRSDTYYRLRKFSEDGTFVIAPHPDGVQLITEGDSDSGVQPVPGKWYRFKVLVKTTRARTRIRAKVWKLKRPEPARWQIDCSDSSEIRIKRGRLGIWSAGTGLKSWRNLEVDPD